MRGETREKSGERREKEPVSQTQLLEKPCYLHLCLTQHQQCCLQTTKKHVTDKTRAKKAAQKKKKMKQTPKQQIRIKTNEIR